MRRVEGVRPSRPRCHDPEARPRCPFIPQPSSPPAPVHIRTCCRLSPLNSSMRLDMILIRLTGSAMSEVGTCTQGRQMRQKKVERFRGRKALGACLCHQLGQGVACRTACINYKHTSSLQFLRMNATQGSTSHSNRLLMRVRCSSLRDAGSSYIHDACRGSRGSICHRMLTDHHHRQSASHPALLPSPYC